MPIYHILKDGRQVDSIEGTVIKVKDFEPIYRVIDAINRRGWEDETAQSEKGAGTNKNRPVKAGFQGRAG